MHSLFCLNVVFYFISMSWFIVTWLNSVSKTVLICTSTVNYTGSCIGKKYESQLNCNFVLLYDNRVSLARFLRF